MTRGEVIAVTGWLTICMVILMIVNRSVDGQGQAEAPCIHPPPEATLLCWCTKADARGYYGECEPLECRTLTPPESERGTDGG